MVSRFVRSLPFAGYRYLCHVCLRVTRNYSVTQEHVSIRKGKAGSIFSWHPGGSCWKPEYRVLANSANRVNERVPVPAQMVLPVRCLYRYERYERIPKPLPIPAGYSCDDSAVGIATGALAR